MTLDKRKSWTKAIFLLVMTLANLGLMTIEYLYNGTNYCVMAWLGVLLLNAIVAWVNACKIARDELADIETYNENPPPKTIHLVGKEVWIVPKPPLEVRSIWFYRFFYFGMLFMFVGGNEPLEMEDE